jgi:hypothetical protein
VFNELLDGNTVQDVVRDDRGFVIGLEGKEELASVVADDDTLTLPSFTLAYDPATRSITIVFDDYLPAESAIGVSLDGGVIADRDGNTMKEEPALAFMTLPVDFAEGFDVPAEIAVDETIVLEFNTAIDGASAAGLVTLTEADTGTEITTTLEADDVALIVTPDAPLTAGTAYELRVDPGTTDLYGFAQEGQPRLFLFAAN